MGDWGFERRSGMGMYVCMRRHVYMCVLSLPASAFCLSAASPSYRGRPFHPAPDPLYSHSSGSMFAYGLSGRRHITHSAHATHITHGTRSPSLSSLTLSLSPFSLLSLSHSLSPSLSLPLVLCVLCRVGEHDDFYEYAMACHGTQNTHT